VVVASGMFACLCFDASRVDRRYQKWVLLFFTGIIFVYIEGLYDLSKGDFNDSIVRVYSISFSMNEFTINRMFNIAIYFIRYIYDISRHPNALVIIKSRLTVSPLAYDYAGSSVRPATNCSDLGPSVRTSVSTARRMGVMLSPGANRLWSGRLKQELIATSTITNHCILSVLFPSMTDSAVLHYYGILHGRGYASLCLWFFVVVLYLSSWILCLLILFGMVDSQLSWICLLQSFIAFLPKILFLNAYLLKRILVQFDMVFLLLQILMLFPCFGYLVYWDCRLWLIANMMFVLSASFLFEANVVDRFNDLLFFVLGAIGFGITTFCLYGSFFVYINDHIIIAGNFSFSMKEYTMARLEIFIAFFLRYIYNSCSHPNALVIHKLRVVMSGAAAL